MDTAYHPDFGTDVNYTFEPMPDDPDAQVAVAISKVCEYINADAQSPVMQEQAARCIEEGAGDAVTGIWNHIKRSMRFRQDADIASDLQTSDPRKNNVVEVFIRPLDQAFLIQLRGMGVEDCDGFTLYGACLLICSGIPCNLVTIAADSDSPRRFSHIYVAAYPDGKRVPLDFSHGLYPGWEGPHLGRIREWPVQESACARLMSIVIPVALIGAAIYGLRYLQSSNRYTGRLAA